MARCIFLALSAMLLAGCAAPPSISVVGSYFPGWLFCIALGIIFGVVVRALLVRTGNERRLGPPMVVYPCLMTFFSLLFWLFFFQN